MHHKPYTKKDSLLQDIKTYTTNKDFCKKQANLSKYASIFACCGAGLATISAIIHAIETRGSDDKTWLLLMTVTVFIFTASVAHKTHKNTNNIAKKYQKKIQKRNRTLKRLYKTR